MKKLLLLISMFSLSQTNAQQNLVLNPSFEDSSEALNCGGTPLGGVLPLNNWVIPSVGTPDVFSLTLDPNCGTYPLFGGIANQSPSTGNNYVGMGFTFNSNSEILNAEYIRGKLSQFLNIGYRYDIEFYVCLGDMSISGMDNIGLKFINNSHPFYQDDDNIPLQADVNYVGPPFMDKDNWTLMSYQFTPNQTNLNAFIIGNFADSNQTNLQSFVEFPIFSCYLLVDDVNVSIELPEFDIPEAICIGDELELPNSSLNGYTGSWSPAPNNQETTTYTFTPTDALIGLVQKTVSVYPKQIPVFDDFEPVCKGVEFELPIISNNGISGTWFPVFDASKTTTYTFTPEFPYCIEEVTKQIEILPELDFKIEQYCDNDSYYFKINNITAGFEIVTYQWKINDVLVENNNPILKLSNYSNLLQDVNLIEIVIIDKNGCTFTNEIKIFGRLFCVIQKGISPNDDNLNDYFDLVSFNGVNLKIYNRYGMEVYSKNNYLKEWKGQNKKDEMLPSGTYFYLIKTQSNEQLSGWIQLTY